ncbi:hypothetical protein FO440_21930 [Mucilaginibacter corticis]|uniref:histidine kinase n=1 Tax=Mucilaginibacter corticis TaxID=2597670 RepID=A0A556M996_9SPHI|nr:ATP-binding protein [Mucilaginibacter corticis]TSJ36494.1 hypothetical protein FO440_21930 [Mucilaginibacter corticis]
MTFDKAVDFWMPPAYRGKPDHARYQELRGVVSTALIGIPLMLLFPVFAHYMGKPISGYLVNDLFNVIMLLTIRWWGHYRVPMTISALTCYWIMYGLVADSGIVYSPNVAIIHMYLLVSIWTDKKWGWLAIIGNFCFFGFFYYATLRSHLPAAVGSVLGEPLYAFGMNELITLFFGGFLAYLQIDQEKARLKFNALQEQKITVLDEAVKSRTDQLNSIRETMATDFHDQTGNMLSAITRQASLLKMKLEQDHEVQPLVDSIISNSNGLYASSKDFLWHLNHHSDEPATLFDYLTGYGQLFYNQFDIAFSAEAEAIEQVQLAPSAALHIIFIFKEAMTNVVKHAGASEVRLRLWATPGKLVYRLSDNGSWKEADPATTHYGLSNMEKRCTRNHFRLTVHKQASGTAVEITVPVQYLI